jgi:hypothetical protein
MKIPQQICAALQDAELRYRFIYNAFPTLTEEVCLPFLIISISTRINQQHCNIMVWNDAYTYALRSDWVPCFSNLKVKSLCSVS